MRKLIMTGCAIVVALCAILPVDGNIICSGESAAVRVNAPVSTSVDKSLTFNVSPWPGTDESVTVEIDGICVFSMTNQSKTLWNQSKTEWKWQPLTTGNHTLKCAFGTNVLTKTLNVTALDFFVQPAPNPPMSKDNNVSITPTTRNFGVNGGGNAILVSGSSATWTAAVSDPWITLNATSGNVGYPVAYTVSANTNVEQRTGYVYVSGWVHTITQDGVGGTISPENREFEHQGGSGTIAVSVANKMVWQARPNVDWLSVSPTSGAGAGSLTYRVAPYNEVATRQGTLTVAGNTFTVFQYGRRMKLDSYNVTKDYETHVIPITVNALAITQWSVTPNNSWISVVDAGNGHGGDLVTIAIAENPSYKSRTGTVKIGTETFTVTQQGRPTAALSFSVSPTASTASVEGANGIIAVTATPDLPWTAKSGANWITVYAATATGAGNGNVVYSASPNPTLSQRTGTVTVTPEVASGMAAKTHKVTQPAATSSLSSNGYEFEAAGESCTVEVSVANIVQWSISESLDWITVNGSTSRTGPGTVTIQATANNTVYPRSGTMKIAGKTFSVSQKACGVELEYDTKLFGTDGGYDSISIHPDGNVSWTAVSSDATWITIFQGDSGTGDGEILYIVSPYVGDGTTRTGWITVGDKKVYITQRAYDLSINPNGSYVAGNNGAGEFGVSATIGDVWTAIVTEPWITLVSGYDSGTGNGVVRFIYTENMTGKTRTGKIIVNGEVYTLEQRARQMVVITATAEHGGHVSGGGAYDLGTQVTLTAVPDSGYRFSHWTGTESSMQNPLILMADAAKSYTAVFEPLPIAFTSVVSSKDGVSLRWNNLAWAGTYCIYRGITSVPSSAIVLVELQNSGNCMYLDTTGDVDVEYWYWIEADGPSDEVMSDPMTGKKERPIVYSSITYENLRGAANPNPATYLEGTLMTFENPETVTGYTFAGWTPSQITSDMTGAQTVRAAWTANSYSIAYDPNGGSGTMDATPMVYDVAGVLAASDFTYAEHLFIGWAAEPEGPVVYSAGQSVTNLTAQSGGVVMLYACWMPSAFSWTGAAGDRKFSTAGNWDSGVVPPAGADVRIEVQEPLTLICDVDVKLNTVVVPESSAVVTIGMGDLHVQSLKNAYKLAIAKGASLTIDGDLVGYAANNNRPMLYSNEGRVTVGGLVRFRSSGPNRQPDSNICQYQVTSANTTPIIANGLAYHTDSWSDYLVPNLGSINGGKGLWVIGSAGTSYPVSRQISHSGFWVRGGQNATLYSSADWTLAETYRHMGNDLRITDTARITLDTTDWNDKTTPRTVTFKGFLYANSSAETPFTVKGCGTLVLDNNVVNGKTNFINRTFAVRDMATLQIKPGKSIYGSGTVSLATGTTLALPAAGSSPIDLAVALDVSEGVGEKAFIRIGGADDVVPAGTYTILTAARLPDVSRLALANIKAGASEFSASADGKTLILTVAEQEEGEIVDVGGGKTLVVPNAWLAEKTALLATDVAANGRKVWECYVLGLDPKSVLSDFRITEFPMDEDGTPDLKNLAFEPAQSEWNVPGARPVIKGASTLAGEWLIVTEENKSQFRYFKVEVVLP